MFGNFSRKVGPFDLGVKKCFLRILFFLLNWYHCFLHLLQPFIRVFITVWRRAVSSMLLLHKESKQGWFGSPDSKLRRVPMDEGLYFSFQISNPFHCEKGLKRGVLHWIRDVRQCIVCKEFRCLGEVSTFSIKELFKLCLLSLQLAFLDSYWLLISVLVIRMNYVDNKVNVKIKL